MSAFQILTRDKQPGDESTEPEIVSYRLPATETTAAPASPTARLPQVVLRLPALDLGRRKLPQIRWDLVRLDLVRKYASWVMLGLGALLAAWLIFGGKRAAAPPVDDAPAWKPPAATAAPTATSAPASPGAAPTWPAPSVAPSIAPAAGAPASAPAASSHELPPAQTNQEPSSLQLPPPAEPAPQDGTAKAVPTSVRTAGRPDDTRWDGRGGVAPGEAAPLGIGTGAPQ